MKFLKKLQLAKKNVSDDRIAVDANSLVYFESTNAMKLPIGSTTQQPGQSGNTITSPANGMIRYNSTTNELEAYQNSAWRNIRFKETTTITQQNIGTGNGTETKFGPLSPIPTAAQNVLVLVENVMQIATTNYTLVQNPGGYAAGWYIAFTSAVPLGKPVTVLHGFDQ
jgi:hypothetical protein